MSANASGSYDHDNIFARILRGEIPCSKIFEDEHVLAFSDINPQAPVHVLVIPRGAYVSFADFVRRASGDEVTGFFRGIGLVTSKLGLDEPGFRLLSNVGADAHQQVEHFHVHLFGGRPLGPMLTGAS